MSIGRNVLVLITAIAGITCVSACSSYSYTIITEATPQPSTSNGPIVPVNPNSVAKLRVSVFIPGRFLSSPASVNRRRAMDSRRHPSYLPLSVNSISFAQTEVAGVTVSGSTTIITIGSAQCANSTGGQTCSTTLVGQLGQDQWLVSTYTSANGTGTALSVANLAKTVVAGAANTSNLTLNPVLSAIAFVPTSGSCSAASACTGSVVVNAIDVTGATIVGPGLFVNASNAGAPITLTPAGTLSIETTAGASAHSSLTQTSDNNLGKYAYDGTATLGTKTITASATGVTTATYTLTLASGTLTAPSSVSIGNTNPTSTTIAVSESGYAGVFSESDNCTGIATIGAASSTGPSATFAVTQQGGGTCSVLISDDHSGSASVSVLSTTYVVTVQ